MVTDDSITVGLVAATVLAALGFRLASGVVWLLLAPRLLDVVKPVLAGSMRCPTGLAVRRQHTTRPGSL